MFGGAQNYGASNGNSFSGNGMVGGASHDAETLAPNTEPQLIWPAPYRRMP